MGGGWGNEGRNRGGACARKGGCGSKGAQMEEVPWHPCEGTFAPFLRLDSRRLLPNAIAAVERWVPLASVASGKMVEAPKSGSSPWWSDDVSRDAVASSVEPRPCRDSGRRATGDSTAQAGGRPLIGGTSSWKRRAAPPIHRVGNPNLRLHRPCDVPPARRTIQALSATTWAGSAGQLVAGVLPR